MGKNHLGLRRSGGSRTTGLGARRSGRGLPANVHNATRPYLPDTPEDNVRDNDNNARVTEPGEGGGWTGQGIGA